jgi:hypothetical protein
MKKTRYTEEQIAFALRQAAHSARRLDAERFRPTNSSSPESCIGPGSHMGAGPGHHSINIPTGPLHGGGSPGR